MTTGTDTASGSTSDTQPRSFTEFDVDADTPVAIVTGGGSGIGRSACRKLAEQGYRVVVVSRTQARVHASLQSLPPSPDQHLGLTLDVTRDGDVAEMVRATLARYQRIDLLVVSAGIGRSDPEARTPVPASDIPLGEWQAVLDVNLHGAFRCCRAVLPTLLAQGQGQVLFVGSSMTPHGLRGQAFAPAYCASKFALMGFVESLADELEGSGVRAQVLCPGAVDTSLVASTALTRAFGGALAADHVGEVIRSLALFPPDSIIPDPHLIPFFPTPSRR
jgi:NAD(P)-dependent dehydrogenase (short-subunit alcohol dehydrogenase family)